MNSTTEYLSKYLTLPDAIKASAGFNNFPSEAQKKSIIFWALTIYDPICEHFGIKPDVHSIFRNDAYNKYIGGDPASDHRCVAKEGTIIIPAAGDLDFDKVPKAPNNKAMFDFVARNLHFKQLIWEKGTNENPAWVHIATADGDNRMRITQCLVVDGKTTYKPFDLYKFPSL